MEEKNYQEIKKQLDEAERKLKEKEKTLKSLSASFWLLCAFTAVLVTVTLFFNQTKESVLDAIYLPNFRDIISAIIMVILFLILPIFFFFAIFLASAGIPFLAHEFVEERTCRSKKQFWKEDRESIVLLISVATGIVAAILAVVAYLK